MDYLILCESNGLANSCNSCLSLDLEIIRGRHGDYRNIGQKRGVKDRVVNLNNA